MSGRAARTHLDASAPDRAGDETWAPVDTITSDPVDAALREAVATVATTIASAPPPDVGTLTALLYDWWYARPHDVVRIPAGFPPSLVEVLRAADTRAAAWDEGWVCDRVHVDGRVIARRGHEVRMLDRCDHLHAHRPGADVRAGDALHVAGRRERVDPSDGFWRIAASRWRFTRPPPRLVRLYCHLEVAALPLLVTAVTTQLPALEDQPSWQLKVAASPHLHARADAAVLYLDADTLAAPVSAVEAIITALRPHARPATPPLTRTVAPGFAAAVDPGGDESFGSHRCRLLAEALVGWPPDAGVEVALDRIGARLEAAGIDPAQPERRREDVELPWP